MAEALTEPRDRAMALWEVVQLSVNLRCQLRQAKRFAEADRLRQLLLDFGIKLHDMPDGETYWTMNDLVPSLAEWIRQHPDSSGEAPR